MNENEIQALVRGAIVSNRGSGNSYVVIRGWRPGRPAIGVLTVEIENAREWDLVASAGVPTYNDAVRVALYKDAEPDTSESEARSAAEAEGLAEFEAGRQP